MTIQKGPLHAALARLLRIISRTTTMPVLQHVKLDADGSSLSIEATDLTTYAIATVPCDGSFSGCLPARALAEFVKPEDAKDKSSIVELLPERGNKITVAVEGALTTMFSLPTSAFPLRPSDKPNTKAWVHQVTWDAAEFSAKIEWVALAASQDCTRAHLTGVFFDENAVVATDGHRMHVAPMAGMAAGPTLIDGRSVAALLGMMPRGGEVVVDRAGDVVRFSVADFLLETTAMSEEFPPYQQVIPSSEDFSVEVDREALLYAIARIAKSKAHGSKGLRIVANGAIRLERDTEDGSTSTTVPVIRTTHEGEDGIIGAAPKYLVDALSSGSDVVTLRFGDALSPIRCDLGDGRVGVVMPMRL